MKTLNHPVDQQEILRRLAQLTETDAALWGLMRVQGMVCHLDDAYKVALGGKPAKAVSSPMPRRVLKWFALHAPLAWPKGVPTLPEVKQGVGGSAPTEFARDRASLLTTVERFREALPSPCPSHAMFGPMSKNDWMRWGYLHADHHLRQFGR